MYKCHLCDLQTKQLNGLMGRHYKIHCNENYSRDEYKTAVLAHNGRQQKLCKICHKITKIPKGEAAYPDYHKKCYASNLLQGVNNPNYKNGKKQFTCAYCSNTRESYSSQTKHSNVFCSISCSTQFYNLPENQSDAKKRAIELQKEALRKLVHTEEFKAKRVAALLKMGATSTSKIEQDFHRHIKEIHLDAMNGHQLDFYSVDIWIPSQNVAIDVQGNYWHNSLETRLVDKRKAIFFANNRPDIKFYTLWESEIKDNSYLYDKPFDITILCGPSGCGKTWVGNQLIDRYEIIDYDKISKMDELLQLCQVNSIKHKLLITPIRATWIAKQLRNLGLRVKVIAIIEEEAVIEQRLKLRNSVMTQGIKNRIKRYNNIKDKICMFYGTVDEILQYLN